MMMDLWIIHSRLTYKYQKQMEGDVFSREFSRKETCEQEQSLPSSEDDTGI